MREAWESVTANAADFKELVPEFFLPGDGGFLVNRHRLALGTKQNGCVDVVGWLQLCCRG